MHKTIFCKSLILFWGLTGSTTMAITKKCDQLDKEGYEVISIMNITFTMNMVILAFYYLVAILTIGIVQYFPVALITARKKNEKN